MSSPVHPINPLPSAQNPFAANTNHLLRGDYANLGDDYCLAQPYEKYTEAEHARWRMLYARQESLLPGYAAQEFIEGLSKLGAGEMIPRLDDMNEILSAATGWRLVAVPGLIPDEIFFDHLANRRFPVTWWLRAENEIDYLVEPDIFHDFFGHVPLLLNQSFADNMREYGLGGKKALQYGAQKMLARLYWYVIEFGLINTADGLRAFGAGMLSSKNETVYSLESPVPHRIMFDLERVLNTDYMVDDFQKTYFVIDSFEELFDIVLQDFTPFYQSYREDGGISPDKILPTDKLYSLQRLSEE